MNRPLRIVVADDDAVMRLYFQRMLPRLGHEVVAVAVDGRELVMLCREHVPDLIISDVLMPELDGIAATAQAFQERPVPVIIVSGGDEANLAQHGEPMHVFGMLLKPIKQADLEPVRALALRRFEQFQVLCRELGDVGRALETRRKLEQAKRLLMKRDCLDEASAFDQLQALARAEGKLLAEVLRGMVAANSG